MGASGKRWDKKGGKRNFRLFYSLWSPKKAKEGVLSLM
jgi:hypothetical protein